jgi:hypothetical protein
MPLSKIFSEEDYYVRIEPGGESSRKRSGSCRLEMSSRIKERDLRFEVSFDCSVSVNPLRRESKML